MARDRDAMEALRVAVAQTRSAASDVRRPDRFEEMLAVTRWFDTRAIERARVHNDLHAALAAAGRGSLDVA
jgi:hypothetical protein